MGTTADKLQNIINSKNAISAAIEAKGGTVPTELSGYGTAIQALPSGGSSDLAKKIVDKSVTEVTSADLSGATSIGVYAFYGCHGLTSVTIPDSVMSIGQSAFSGCHGLTSVTIPDSVTSIGKDAFRYCSSMTSISISNAVGTINTYTFNGCTSLATIDFGTTRTTIPTLSSTSAFTNLPSNYQILVPSALLTNWKAANNWNNSDIVDHIVAHP